MTLKYRKELRESERNVQIYVYTGIMYKKKKKNTWLVSGKTVYW